MLSTHPVGLKHGPTDHIWVMLVAMRGTGQGLEKGRVPSAWLAVAYDDGPIGLTPGPVELQSQVLDLHRQALPELYGFKIAMLLDTQMEFRDFLDSLVAVEGQDVRPSL